MNSGALRTICFINALPDLRALLREWLYDPEDNIRRFTGFDGRELIVVRLPMGFEQFEVSGRPDGERPHGMESLLDVHRARLGAAKSNGTEKEFRLEPFDCAALFQEGQMRCRRAVLFARIKDWTCMTYDVEWLHAMADLVERHAVRAVHRTQARCWRSNAARLNLQIGPSNSRGTSCNASLTVLSYPLRHRGGNGREQRTTILALPEEQGGELDEMSIGGVPLCLIRSAAFILQGEYWTVRFEGHTANIKQSCGMRYMAQLLRNPGREFHVCQMHNHLTEFDRTAEALGDKGMLQNRASLQAGIPVMNSQAKVEYKQRISELRSDLAEALDQRDSARATAAREELELLERQLASAFGLGGRNRKTGSEAERARTAVTKRIKETNARLAATIPALGRHLSARIKTGYFCSYNPLAERPIAWDF
jgi:hypothetical protein